MGTARVLSTKKLLPSQKQFLLNAGLAVLEADFITIQYKRFRPDNVGRNLIFTSQNSVISFLQNEKSDEYYGYPVFCVGSKTRAAIEGAGFTVAASAEYAEELARIITERHAGESFTFFSGSMRRDTLPDALTDAGIDFNEIGVYETVLSPHKITAPLDAVLFFSPSGVESYRKENAVGDAVCFCIGTTTAEALEGITDKIVIANKPTVDNVIVRCINYYKD